MVYLPEKFVPDFVVVDTVTVYCTVTTKISSIKLSNLIKWPIKLMNHTLGFAKFVFLETKRVLCQRLKTVTVFWMRKLK